MVIFRSYLLLLLCMSCSSVSVFRNTNNNNNGGQNGGGEQSQRGNENSNHATDDSAVVDESSFFAFFPFRGRSPPPPTPPFRQDPRSRPPPPPKPQPPAPPKPQPPKPQPPPPKPHFPIPSIRPDAPPPQQLQPISNVGNLFSSLFDSLLRGGDDSTAPAPGPGPKKQVAADPSKVALVKDVTKSAIFEVLQEHEDHDKYDFHAAENAVKAHPHALRLHMPGSFGVHVYQMICKLLKICHRDEIHSIMKDISLPAELKCPPADEDISCNDPLHVRYRSADGSCNNINHPSWGQSFTPLLRSTREAYADGISELRRSVSGRELPNARFISTSLHSTESHEHEEFNHLLMTWGQFTDHDITFVPGFGEGEDGKAPMCCPKRGVAKKLHPECMPIIIPRGDDYFKEINTGCLELVRSIAAPEPHCMPRARQQMNQITAFIDCSNVYGSTHEVTTELRTFVGGMLKVTPHQFGNAYLDLLPSSPGGCCGDCRCEFPSLHSFMAGDERVNEVPTLTTVHTMFHRYHNFLADLLSSVNPTFTDEELFLETRRIVGAISQLITYKQWLPLILGEAIMNEYSLKVSTSGYTSYDPTINPGITNEFATVAFRFGHTLINNIVYRVTNTQQNYPELLARTFFSPTSLHLPNLEGGYHGIDPIMKGLINQPCESFDANIVESVRDFLFQDTDFSVEGKQKSHDLPARNIMRGRDHGIPGYTKLRELCGSKYIYSFEDLYKEDIIPTDFIDKLASIYYHVDDIDAFPAGIAERSISGGLVGPTFACIIARQFQQLKFGDRLFFEHQGSSQFTPAQLHNLRDMSLSSVFCVTSESIGEMPTNPFLVPGPHNPLVPCHTFTQIDVNLFT